MPSNLFGLPVHILVVHAVVVLLPLAGVAALLVAASRTVRERLGLAILAGTFLVTLSVPIATQSGESLRARLPNDAMIARHASVGQALLVWAAVFGLALALVVALDLYRRARTHGRMSGLESRLVRRLMPGDRAAPSGSVARGPFLLARLALVAVTVGMLVVVVLAGDSGARAVWDRYPNLAPTAGAHGGTAP